MRFVISNLYLKRVIKSRTREKARIHVIIIHVYLFEQICTKMKLGDIYSMREIRLSWAVHACTIHEVA